MIRARVGWVLLSLFWLLQTPLSARQLPILIEDSHAGSFRFFAQHLDLDEAYTLVLIDAHSDASGVPGSDRIRSGLRQVISRQQRIERAVNWRQQGVIQPFNWIEPLMPRPIKRVIWIAGDNLIEAQIDTLQKEARVQLDWQTQAEPRKAGDLALRYEVTDWKRFQARDLKKLGKIVLSIDLDYFAGKPEPLKQLHVMWRSAVQWGQLEAVSFALSMPWQRDKVSAMRLLQSAFEHALSIPNSQIHFEPFLNDINDRSEMAKSYFLQGKKPPRFVLGDSPVALRELMLRHQGRIHVRHNPLAFQEQMRQWQTKIKAANLVIKSAQVSADGVWRLRANEIDDIWLESPDPEVSKFRWWLHTPEKSSYNIIPNSGLGKGFASNAPAYIVMQRKMLIETDDPALAARTWRQWLPADGKFGIVRLQAECVTDTGSYFSNVIEIRVRQQDGFLGALEEQFGSPYVFGIGSMKHAGESGPETLLGNDCANFLVYAARQNGRAIPWSNPAQLKRHLEPAKGPVREGDIVHLGSHVAVVYQDLGIAGLLENSDTLVHHLSGFPELGTVAQITKGKPYQLMRWKQDRAQASIQFGGDVCLHGEVVASADLLEKIKQTPTIANLECVVSDRAKALRKKRFNYIVPTEKAAMLNKFKALSLANNHAGDGGAEGLQDTIGFLHEKGISHFGAGMMEQACTVKILEIKGVKVGLLGMNLVEPDGLPAGPGKLGVASWPQHQRSIQKAIANARAQGVQTIIAMPHWGDEYTTKVNQQQRDAGKWLIRHGVDAVIGSHPHIKQHQEFYRGKRIVYSLGNLIFTKQQRKGFNQAHLLELRIGPTGVFIP